jgi:hypothetical protein
MVFAKNSDNSHGIPFFKIKTPDSINSIIFVKIDFIFLTSSQKAEQNTLFISAIKTADSAKKEKIKISTFEWERKSPNITSNIAYEIQDNNDIVIWCKCVTQWEGFSFKVQLLESNTIVKPSIMILNKMFVSNIYQLPEDLKYEPN